MTRLNRGDYYVKLRHFHRDGSLFFLVVVVGGGEECHMGVRLRHFHRDGSVFLKWIEGFYYEIVYK